MTAEIITWRGITTLPLDPKRVLDKAREVEFESVMVIGADKDGELYFASSDPDGGNALWLMEIAKKALIP